MASEAPPVWMPALALFDGENLERRVRRLLQDEAFAPPRRPSRRAAAAALGMFVAVAALWAAAGPRPLHDLLEWAVRNLP